MAETKNLHKELPFSGKLMTSDPAAIGQNFRTLTNMRYTDTHIKSVGGMTKINSAATINATYLKGRSAFHFVKSQPAESHVIVQAYNTDFSASQLMENTTAIPNAGAFSATGLNTASTHPYGFFSGAPDGQMIYCDSFDAAIWGGNEMKCGAFVTSTAAVTDTGAATNPKDRTDIINNTKTDSANQVLIGNSESVFPAVQSDTYVKATTKFDTNFWPYFATDPTEPLTGAQTANQWLSGNGVVTNQRFHIDLGTPTIVKRIYYENSHSSGGTTDAGVQNFTLWGSNVAAAFAELTYGTDTDWTELTVSQNTFDQHAAADASAPKYITVTNTTAYRYYAFKFADNYGNATYMGVRRIELKTTASNDSVFLVGSPRPLKGIKIYVQAANVTASTLTGKEWDGAAWAALTLTDNTDTGASLAQTGTVTFASTVASSKPKYL